MRRAPPFDWTDGRSVAASLLIALLIASTAAPVAADPQTTTQGPTPTFEVRLLQDGSALVSIKMTFDLETESEREAFRRLKAGHENLTERFAERLRRVARATENETGREMRVSDASAAFLTIDETHTGVVTLSVRWTNLARTEGDRLVLSEPFASGFQPDRRFVVTAPDGYRIVTTTPAADSLRSDRAAWQTGTDLTGFRVTFKPDESADTGEQTPTKTSGPTPLPTALLVALAVLVAFARRR